MNTQIDLKKELIYLKNQIKKGGPTSSEYREMDEWYNTVWSSYKDGDCTIETIEEFRKEFSVIYNNPATMFGLVFSAPYGYRGDFEIIDRIYRKHISPIKQLSNWDQYFHSFSACKAVRNRKEYFKKLLVSKVTNDSTLKVLNLASGPCRDLKEFYEEFEINNIEFDCVEFDPRAISYAKKLLNPKQKVTFIEQNIFKFTTDKKYDLIWSAGLFDYFDNKTFSRILKRILNYTNDNGEIVIGNFHPKNPTRNCMEFTLWQLNHRENHELITLAKMAGVNDLSKIIIEEEAEGVNLFMRIKQSLK